MSATQITLEGEETDAGRVKPDTFKWCLHCDEFVLRSRWEPHERHDWEARGRYTDKDRNEYDPRDDDGSSDTSGGGVTTADDGPEKVGEWFDVRIHKTVEYAFRIPAWDKHRAKEIAKERAWDASPVDSYAVHTEVSSRGDITTEDVPDDFDPYGSTELWEVFED